MHWVDPKFCTYSMFHSLIKTQMVESAIHHHRGTDMPNKITKRHTSLCYSGIIMLTKFQQNQVFNTIFIDYVEHTLS